MIAIHGISGSLKCNVVLTHMHELGLKVRTRSSRGRPPGFWLQRPDFQEPARRAYLIPLLAPGGLVPNRKGNRFCVGARRRRIKRRGERRRGKETAKKREERRERRRREQRREERRERRRRGEKRRRDEERREGERGGERRKEREGEKGREEEREGRERMRERETEEKEGREKERREKRERREVGLRVPNYSKEDASVPDTLSKLAALCMYRTWPHLPCQERSCSERHLGGRNTEK